MIRTFDETKEEALRAALAGTGGPAVVPVANSTWALQHHLHRPEIQISDARSTANALATNTSGEAQAEAEAASRGAGEASVDVRG